MLLNWPPVAPQTNLPTGHEKGIRKTESCFDQNPAQADQLLAMGDSPREKSIDAKEHATWTVLASMILNLDETLNRE